MNRLAQHVAVCALVGFACGGSSPKSDPDAGPVIDAAAVDTTAPGAVTDFTATLNAGSGDVDLTWTNPGDDDFAGVVLVRTAANPSGGTPTSATAVDDAVGEGSAIFNDSAQAAQDSGVSPGSVVYEIWPYDEAGNVGEPTMTQLVAPIPSQSASIQIDPVNLTVTVPTNFEHFELSGTVEHKRASTEAFVGFGSGILFESAELGAAGNGSSIQLISNGADDVPPTVEVLGTAVTVTFARNVHSSRDIAAAIAANAEASAILTATPVADGIQMSNFGPALLDGGSDEIVVCDLALTNTGVNRMVFNAKAVLSSLSVGVATTVASIDGDDAVWFGPRGLNIGDPAAIGTLEITGHGDALIDVDVDFRDDPTVFVPARRDSDLYVAVDSSGSGGQAIGTGGAIEYGGAFNEYPGTRGAVVSPDARFLLIGSRTMPSVNMVDLTTMEPVLGVDLGDGTGVGSVETVKLSPDGAHLYGIVNHGRHASAFYTLADLEANGGHICKLGDGTCVGAAPTAELVKMSYPGLEIEERLTLFTDSPVDARARDFEMSADGTIGAVPFVNAGVVAIINLETMSVQQEVDVSSVNLAPREVAVSPDGATTYVGYRSGENPAAGVDIDHDGSVTAIDNTTYALTSLTPPNMLEGQSAGTFEMSADGKLYLGRKQVDTPAPLVVYDPETDSWTATDVPDGRSHLMVFTPDGEGAFDYVPSLRVLRYIDLATGTHTILPTHDNIAPAGHGHSIAMTPY